ncbi:hypothetical protein WJX82_002492 [Trebouxia sp. C0006]
MTSFPDTLEGLAQALVAPESSPERRLELGKKLHSSLDILQTPTYSRFLKAFFPVFTKLLEQLPLQQQPETSEHKLRRLVVDVLQRLPQNETIKPYIHDLLRQALQVIKSDNEENALICMHIFSDVFRTHKPQDPDSAVQFLEFVKGLYKEFAATYKHWFEFLLPRSNQKLVTGHHPSNRSFKIVAECPVIVMYIFNFHQNYTREYVPDLIPCMVDTASLKGIEPEQVTDQSRHVFMDFKLSQIKTISFLTYLLRTFPQLVAPHLQQLSDALVQLMRTCPDIPAMRKELLVTARHTFGNNHRGFYSKLDILLNEDVLIGKSRACQETLRPPAASTLAELIVHVRSELTLQQIQRIVYMFSRNLQDPNAPVSTQGTSIKLLHSVVEVMFARHADRTTADSYRLQLGRILDVFVSKLSFMKSQIPKLLAAAKKEEEELKAQKDAAASKGQQQQQQQQQPPSQDTVAEPTSSSSTAARAALSPSAVSGGIAFAARSHQGIADKAKEVQDAKVLLNTLVTGFKHLLYSMVNFGNTTRQLPSRTPIQTPLPSIGLREDEVRLTTRFLTCGVACLRLYTETSETKDGITSGINNFADVFNVLSDARDMVEIFTGRMPFLFDALLADPALVHLLQQLLIPAGPAPVSSAVSRHVAPILLQYLVEHRLTDLQQPSSKEGILVLKCFQLSADALDRILTLEQEGILVLKCIQLLADALDKILTLEQVLVSNFHKQIEAMLKSMSDSKEHLGFLKMFLSLFRVLATNGKHGLMMNVFGNPALLVPMLTTFKSMLEGPNTPEARNMLIELILSIPARLSDLLVVLTSLMRPLVMALQEGQELVGLGLRTLEYWVDSLNPEFLEPAMQEVIGDLMSTLWGHLKPQNNPFGPRVLNLLGKMGGRNRRFLRSPAELEYKENPEHGLRLILTFQPSTSFLVPLDRSIALCRAAVNGTGTGKGVDIYTRKQALLFLHVCLASVLNLRSPDDSQLPGSQLDKLVEMLFGDHDHPHIEPTGSDGGVKTKTQLLAERHVLKQLLSTAVGAAADTDLAVDATPFAHGVCRHFAMLFAAGCSTPKSASWQQPAGSQSPEVLPGGPPSGPPTGGSGGPTNAAAGEPDGRGKASKSQALKELDAHLFFDALVEVLLEETTQRVPAALHGLAVFVDTLRLLVEAQQSLNAPSVSPRHSSPAQPREDSDLPSTITSMEEDQQGVALAQNADDAAAAAMDSAEARRPKEVSPSADDTHPAVIDELVPRLIHCCYADKWPQRIGGVAAVSMVMQKLPITWLQSHVPDIIKAALAVLKHLPSHASLEQAQLLKALTTVMHLVVPKAAHASAAADQPPARQPPAGPQGGSPKAEEGLGSPSKQVKMMSGILEVLAREVLNPASTKETRDAAHTCLQIMAEGTRKSVSELLASSAPKIASNLQKRRLIPFKSLPTQMGTVAALTYCLKQHPALLTLGVEICLIASDAFQVLELGDQQLLNLIPASRSVTTESVGKLRRVCMEFLAACISWDQFSDGSMQVREGLQLPDLRQNIIQLFFKHLTSPDEAIIATAQQGLAHVISNHKMPKGLLQLSLRPILVNLAYHNKLKLPLLKGLARLLQLLASWFNVTLGEKLIEHLKKWLDTTKLLETPHSWEPGQESDIAAAILELFHLLPQQASKFLETQGERPGLVVLTIELEGALAQMPGSLSPSRMWSPYRQPLAKFLNKYSADAINYFLEPTRLQNTSYFWRFLDIIKSPTGKPLLDQLAASTDKLVAIFKGPGESKPPVPSSHEAAQFDCIHLLRVMVKLLPTWLPDALFEVLQARWNSRQRLTRIAQEEHLQRHQVLETRRIAKCYLNYISNHRDRVQPLFELLTVVSHKTRCDYTFVKDFYVDLVADKYTVEEKKKVLAHFLTSFKVYNTTLVNSTSREEVGDQLAYAMKLIIIPLLSRSFELGQHEIVADVTVDSMVKDMFDPAEEVQGKYSDAINVELLQMATLLMRNLPNSMATHRKELIKFGWNHLKREESSNKYHAFLNVCHFLEAYQAPEKIVLQVFVALLRISQPDGRRAIIRQALDVLTPALVRRLPQGENRYPIWIRYTKKILVEEGHSMNHLTHIWQLVVRHEQLFYTSRAQFVPQMVNSLTKLGMAQGGSNLENRSLAIDLCGVMVLWEERRIKELQSGATQSQDVHASSRKRSRPSSAEASAVPPKEEAEELGEPARQRPRTGDAAQGQSIGTLQSIDSLQATSDATGQSSAPPAVATASAPISADAPAATGDESAPPTDPAQNAADTQQPVASVAVRTPPGEPPENGGSSEAGKQDEVHQQSLGDPGGGAKEAVDAMGEAAGGTQGDGLDGSQRVEEHFQPSLPMQEMVVNFLLRMAFVIGGDRDHDLQALLAHTKTVLSKALGVWPKAAVKVNYISKLLQNNAHHNLDPPPTLLTGLDVMSTLVDLQPQKMVQECGQELVLMLEPCFASKHHQISQRLSKVLLKLYQAMGEPKQEQPNQQLMAIHHKVHFLINSSLQACQDSSKGPIQPTALLALCCSLQILEDLATAVPAYAHRFTTELVKVMRRISEDHSTQKGLLLAPIRPVGRNPKAEPVEPLFGTLVWAMWRSLRLAFRKVLTSAENKKLFLQTMVQLITTATARQTDPALLRECLTIVRLWLLEPENGVALTDKEAVLFLTRLAALDNAMAAVGSARELWQTTFLDLLYTMCTRVVPPHGEQLQTDAFDKVEMTYGLGLRASDPVTRDKFYKLWNKAILPSLFERLKHVILVQNWEEMGNNFWLKQAVDLLLAILVDKEPIKLAPSSSQIPALLAKTKQNIFDVRAQQQAAQRYQQRFQPRPSSGGSTPRDVVMGEASRRDSQVSLPGPPALLPTASGINLAAEVDQVNADTAPGGAEGQTVGSQFPRDPSSSLQGAQLGEPAESAAFQGEGLTEPQNSVGAGALINQLPAAAPTAGSPAVLPAASQEDIKVKPELQDPTATMDTAPYPPSPQEASVVKVEPPINTSGDPSTDPANLTPPPGAQQMEVAGREGGAEGAGAAAVGVKAEPSQDSLMQEASFQDMDMGAGDAGPVQLPPGEQVMTQHVVLPPNVLQMLQEHTAFLHQQGQLKVSNLVTSLREIAHADSQMAYHLWVLVFPIVWATLAEKKDQQVQLAKPIIQLLSKEHHGKQTHHRPNVVQALLEGISLSQPQPKLPSELIKFLGKTYNAWHIAIPLLESHVVLFPHETRCFDALAELYSDLAEDDILYGLWKRRCIHEATRAGLSLVQHGYLEQAQNVFLDSMKIDTKSPAPNGKMTTRGEQVLWQQQYLNCCSELGQWDVVHEYARGTENYAAFMDVAWKCSDWQGLKEWVLPKGAVEDTPRVSMVKAFVLLQDGDVTSANLHTENAITQTLHRWWQMPEICIMPSIPLLASFQQLTELSESSHILQDLSRQQNRGPIENQYSHLKDILETWRLRTPNEWERVSTWSDIMLWRNVIYNIVINAFQSVKDVAPHLHQLGYRDRAWSVNRLGAVARKHGSYASCVRMTNTLYGFNAMEVQEAFVKIREQARAHLHAPGELTLGLHLVNSTNLDYFQPQHQAELFRLKGQFMQALGERDQANSNYSTALTIWDQLPDGWLSWGSHCDEMYESSGNHAWLEYAVSCYLQAVKHGSCAGRTMLPRVLHLLSFENDTGAVGRALDRKLNEVPLWVWLVWSPQLLMSLQRGEGPHARALLTQIAQAFPQAIYYSLRTMVLCLREFAFKVVQEKRAAAAKAQQLQQPQVGSGSTPASGAASPSPMETTPSGGVDRASSDAVAVAAAAMARTKSQGTENTQGPSTSKGAEPAANKAETVTGSSATQQRIEKPQEVISFEAAKELMEFLRSKHPTMAQVLEVVLGDIGSRFVPKPEERLLAVVHALLLRCYKLPFSNAADVPTSLKRELHGVCKACFSSDTVNRHSRSSRAAVATIADYKDRFIHDLNPEAPGFPSTLGDLATKLKAWKDLLQNTVEDSMPAALSLEHESPVLHEQSLVDIEMPGQYMNGDEPSPDGIVFLEGISSNVHVVRRHCSSYRRLGFIGTDGRTRHFIVQTGQHWHGSTGSAEERMMQLLRLINGLLEKHPESRSRKLAAHAPIIVPVYSQIRLVEEDTSYCTYGEAYEVNCARYGRQPDQPIVQFKKRICDERGQLIIDPKGELRQQAYRDIETSIVTENVFSQYMYKTLPTCSHLWNFKKQFCSQLALSGLLSHVMLIGGRIPAKICFARNSGKTFQIDFYPSYDQSGVLERSEPVPFRLTRNLQTFFTPFGVEGVFITAMAVAAQASIAHHSGIAHILSMFFRDDVMAWNKRVQGKAPNTHPLKPAQLKPLVQRNVKDCVDRLQLVAPSLASDGVQKGAVSLVEAALNPRNLCRMDPTWHPWF